MLLSAFFFYFASSVIRLSLGQIDADSALFVFYRSFVGLLGISLVLILKRKLPKIKEYKFLTIRVFGSLVSIAFMFEATYHGTVAKANILNLTYPLFIVVFLLLFSKKEKDYRLYLTALLSFIGVYLVAGGVEGFFEKSTLLGLSSGATAAVAVMALSLTRKYHDTEVILFYLFLGGTIALLILDPDSRNIPSSTALSYLVASASLGGLGQFFFTYGFRFVSAEEGGILSNTRIIIAALLGPLVVGDVGLDLVGFLGAGLIFLANVYVIRNKVVARAVDEAD